MNNDNLDTNLYSRRKFLASWASPIVISVALPVHAQVTDPAPKPNILDRSLKLNLQIQNCSRSSIRVQICNNEPFDVAIIGASAEQYPPRIGSWLVILNTVSHTTPFIIKAGTCITATFSPKSSRSYGCNPSWRLVVGGYSTAAYAEYDQIRGGASILLGGNGAGTSTPVFR